MKTACPSSFSTKTDLPFGLAAAEVACFLLED